MTFSRICCVLSAATLVLLGACALPANRQAPETARNLSPNFDARRPNLVVIHHTSDRTAEEALQTLTSPERKVSAHYLIGRDGVVLQLVEEGQRAWHAGKSWWGGQTDVNSASIGIELDNDGFEPFPDVQIDALLQLLAGIKQRYGIPVANFVGHADVAPGRKDDPSILFPWRRLAHGGFGLWCDEPVPPAPAGGDLWLLLTSLGYDPALPEASRAAFRLHFDRSGQAPSAERDAALATCLLNQKAGAQR